MSLNSREFRLVIRFLIIGYILGYFGLINSFYAGLGYIIYKIIGFDLWRFVLRTIVLSGEVGAVLFNKMAEFRESPSRISAEYLSRFATRLDNTSIYPKILESEARLVDWLNQIQHRRVGEFFGMDPVSSETVVTAQTVPSIVPKSPVLTTSSFPTNFSSVSPLSPPIQGFGFGSMPNISKSNTSKPIKFEPVK